MKRLQTMTVPKSTLKEGPELVREPLSDLR